MDWQDPSFRESDVKDYWMDRNQRILNWLLCERSSIICLQVLLFFPLFDSILAAVFFDLLFKNVNLIMSVTGILGWE